MDSYQTDIVFVVLAIVVFLLALRQKPKVEKGLTAMRFDDWLRAEAEIVNGHSTSDSNVL